MAVVGNVVVYNVVVFGSVVVDMAVDSGFVVDNCLLVHADVMVGVADVGSGR